MMDSCSRIISLCGELSKDIKVCFPSVLYNLSRRTRIRDLLEWISICSKFCIYTLFSSKEPLNCLVWMRYLEILLYCSERMELEMEQVEGECLYILLESRRVLNEVVLNEEW